MSGVSILPDGDRVLEDALAIVENPAGYLFNNGYPIRLDWVVSIAPVSRTEVCTEVETTTTIYTTEIGTETTETEQTNTSTTTTMETGWDAGAKTVGSLSGDGRFSFKLDPNTLGVVCGIGTATDSVDPFQITYSFTGAQGRYKATVCDRFVFSGTVFTIQRIGNEITWLVDEVEVDSLANGLTGTLSGRASIYSSGDAVFDALFTSGIPDELNEIGGDNTLPSLISEGSGGKGEKSSSTNFLPMLQASGSQSAFVGGNGQLPSLTAWGNESGSLISGQSSLFALTSIGESITILRMGGLASLFALTSTGDGHDHFGDNNTLPSLFAYGQVGANGYGHSSLPMLTAYGHNLASPIPHGGYVNFRIGAKGFAREYIRIWWGECVTDAARNGK
jgi:hypothetical protein